MSVSSTPATAEPADTGSQAVKAQLRLRELILGGTLRGGERLVELSIVERLGVSRTPIRAALMRLEQEGLIESLPSGGYAVRTFSEREVAEAIELRGTVEGLAARLAAERGAPPDLLAEAGELLDRVDALLAQSALDDDAFSKYVDLNERFHQLLSALCGSKLLARELERVANLPYASPSAFVVMQSDSPQARDLLLVAQDQHRQVLDAISRREGARADALMREHSRIAQRNLRQALQSHSIEQMPGVRLVREPDGEGKLR